MFNNSFNIFTYIFSFLLFLMCLNSSAIANPKYSSIIMEEHSGKILYSRSPNEKRYPASMTKVMTLYIVFEEIKKGTLNHNSKITFSKRAAGQPPSKIGLNIGQSIKLKEAIYVLVTKSANDVATAIAEKISGTGGLLSN